MEIDGGRGEAVRRRREIVSARAGKYGHLVVGALFKAAPVALIREGRRELTPMNPELSKASWYKSSYSGNGGNCVEIAPEFPGFVPVRDSKDPSGPALVFPASAWRAFVAGVQAGEFGTV
ncbi:DUF397 domain-containing protein [Kitasatospora sp. NPDC058115]|uniref:DUF397 domain-containing protein n=1 Tax=unclassified Kitasatospora TaxID=2633591 RepID=UPI00367A809C